MHVACACVTVYWASQLILSFQVLIVFVDGDCFMDDDRYDFMGLAPILRRVQASSTIRCETPIYIILYVLRDVRTLFMYYF